MGSVIGYQEAHGPVATFETDVAGKIKNLIVDIEPVQEGAGDPSPDNIRPITGWTDAKVTRCGKNLFDKSTVTPNSWIVVNTTDIESAQNYFVSDFIPVKSGLRIICTSRGASRCIYYDKRRTPIQYFSWSTGVLTPLYDGYIRVTGVNAYLDTLQIELGSTATEYEPYVGSTYDITFPSEAGTVYGGTLDVVKGELVVDRAQITSYNGETLPGEWISDRDVYAAGASPTTGAQVVYDLATPITYQLTPQEVSTIIGTNTIYADTGDTSVIYPKTITPIETVSNVNLMELRRSIMTDMQHNYIPEITTYGVEWNYNDPSTVLKRTGAASKFANPIPAESLGEVGWSPFDNVYPWSEMKRYNIINGEVAYSQDDAGYSETDYDTVVYIPEFYYYAYKDTTNQKWNWSISAKPLEGYEKHPGSGCYVGRFHTSGSSSGVFSKSGATLLTNLTRANFRTYSHNKGSNWWQIDLKTWSAIQLLYLIEFANYNSQEVLGVGQASDNLRPNGATTNAIYHTIKINNFYGNMYRWIENIIYNATVWIDGISFSYRRVYINTNNASYSDAIVSQNATSLYIPSLDGWITNFGYDSKCPWAFIPDGSSTDMTSIPDKIFMSNNQNNVMTFGGLRTGSISLGIFYVGATDIPTAKFDTVGSRLIYIPTV